MMREADFAALLHLVERLSLEQRTALGRALAAASGESEAIRLLQGAGLAGTACPPRALPMSAPRKPRRYGCSRKRSSPHRAARTVPRRPCSGGAMPAACAATAAR